MLLTISMICWGIAWSVSIVGHLVLYTGWKKNKNCPDNLAQPPFSVLIAARNEQENLRTYLPTVLHQNYPNYEVIVALDRCGDESKNVLLSLQQNYSNLHFCEISDCPSDWSPKKYALTQAIQLSKYDHLAFTDADCAVSRDWLASLANYYYPEIEIVLGISPYFAASSFVNYLIQYDTQLSFFQYIGFAKWGLPYMGVGRNLSYKKSLFERVGGFTAHAQHLSGDDDLFVKMAANSENTAVATASESLVFSIPKKNLSQWIRQKNRHVSTGVRYTKQTQFLLTSLSFAQMGFYFWGVVLLCLGIEPICLLLGWLIKIMISWVIFWKLYRQLGINKESLHFYPILDVLYAFYQATIVPIGLLRTPKW